MNRIYRTGQGGFILFSVLFALRVGALVVEEEIAQTLFKSLIDFFKFIVVLDHCQICFAVLLNDLEGENLVLAFENFFAVVIYGQQRDIASVSMRSSSSKMCSLPSSSTTLTMSGL